MSRLSILLNFIFISLILLAYPLHAQLSGEQLDTPQAATNPNPDENDYLIPLPCNLSMAFRLIFIPEEGYAGEYKGVFGTNIKVKPDDGVLISNDFNGKHTSYLGSPLSVSELPENFRPKAIELEKQMNSESNNHQLYLIGKYEVTNGQWEAVMNNKCKLNAESSLPVVNISWYQAVSFTEKLMTYILSNSPDSLPSFAETKTRYIGVLRLPTEEEWEFAARGGHYVSSIDLLTNDFFPMSVNSLPQNFGLFIYSDIIPSSPTRIGRFLPNPAGLYDVIGNVEEMIYSPYRMILGDRIHGSSGGFLVKGGCYNDRLDNVVPGARRESPFFFRNGPSINEHTGFRLAISSVNITTAPRIEALKNEYKEIKKYNVSYSGNDPLENLQKIIDVTESAQQKEALNNVLISLQDYNEIINSKEKNMVREHIWSLTYSLMTLRTTRQRLNQLDDTVVIISNSIKKIQDQLKTNVSNINVNDFTKKLQEFETILKKANDTIKDFEAGYDSQRRHYERLLYTLNEYDRNLIDKEYSSVLQDIKSNDFYSIELKKCLSIVNNNIIKMFSGTDPSKILTKELEADMVQTSKLSG
jgi:hypothetical protein